MNHPNRGFFSFADGFKVPDAINLVELAGKSKNDLEHVVNILLNQDSEESELLAERLFEMYA